MGLAVGAAVVVIGAVVGSLLIFRGSGDNRQETIKSTLAVVGASQEKVNAAVAPDGSAETLGHLRDTSVALAAALDQATTQIHQSAPNPADAALVDGAIAAHTQYAQALTKVGTTPSTAKVAQLEKAEELRPQVTNAYNALRQRVDIPIIPLDTSLAAMAGRIRAAQKADLEVKTFASRMNQLVQASSRGRGEIVSVIARTEACDLPPDQASAQITSVADNRQSVLNQIAGVTPPTPATQEILDALQEGLTHSREADRHFAQWVLSETSWYYSPPVGCPSGRMPRNEFHANATRESGAATAAKRRFVSLYNPLAKRYGLPTWTESRI